VTNYSEVRKRNGPRREVRTHLQFAAHRLNETPQGAHESDELPRFDAKCAGNRDDSANCRLPQAMLEEARVRAVDVRKLREMLLGDTDVPACGFQDGTECLSDLP
jgi:hypothetical protein